MLHTGPDGQNTELCPRILVSLHEFLSFRSSPHPCDVNLRQGLVVRRLQPNLRLVVPGSVLPVVHAAMMCTRAPPTKQTHERTEKKKRKKKGNTDKCKGQLLTFQRWETHKSMTAEKPSSHVARYTHNNRQPASNIITRPKNGGGREGASGGNQQCRSR